MKTESESFSRRVTPGGAAYFESGTGEPLVLVHGVGLRLEAWAPQIAAFAPRYRVIAVDMPGHGGSARIDDDARLAQFASWLGRFLREVDAVPANLVGHSMGALVSLGQAVTEPAQAARLALICAVYDRDAAARAAIRERVKMLLANRLDIEEPLARWYQPERSENERRICESTRRWLSALDPAGYATAYRAFAEGDGVFAHGLRELECPALFLTGELDPNSTPAMSEAMAEAAPHGELVVVPGERHMVPLVAPEPVNAALAQWLARPVVTSEAPR